MNAIESAIVKIDKKLQGVPFDFAFLGGSVLSLLVTDPVADAIRVTKDLDVMVDVKSRLEFHKAERVLERRGFRHDTREGAPICRWTFEEMTVDVLPIREEVLGWKSRWFCEALGAANVMRVGSHEVKIISAPYFVALKLEAFEERGKGDFITSTDFEDVICLFNGRETVAEEILSLADSELRNALAAKFRTYLQSPEMEDAIDGFVQTEPEPERRKAAIIAKFRQVALQSMQPAKTLANRRT